MNSDPAGQLNFHPEEWPCEVCQSFLLSLFKLPLRGHDLPFHTPPLGARPDTQHPAAIGKPNADGFVGLGFRIRNCGVAGSHADCVTQCP